MSDRRTDWSRRVRRLLGVACLVLGFGYAVASYAASLYLTGSYSRPAVPVPAVPGLAHEDLTLRTTDGVQLEAWVVEPQAATATVLLFHGWQEHRPARVVELFATRGYRCLAIDFRAHGESEGDVVSFGWHERHDVEAAVRYARERWPGERLFAWARSMGAAAVVYAAGTSTGLDGVVLEGLYSSIDRATSERLSDVAPAPLHFLAFGFRWITEWRLGVEEAHLAPTVRLARFESNRVLLSCGANDHRAGPDELERLHAALPGAATYVVVGAGHGGLFASDAYRERVLAFLASRSR